MRGWLTSDNVHVLKKKKKLYWGRVGDTGFSSAARRTRADARSVLGASHLRRTCVTVLWKKMAAGDLSWWPHACAARRRRARAQNFATSGFHFIEASVNEDPYEHV